MSTSQKNGFMQEPRPPVVAIVRKGGEKEPNKPGADLDHFRVTNAPAYVLSRWYEVFGDRPDVISGYLPFDSLKDNLSISDELWDGPKLIWSGNGEKLIVWLSEDGTPYFRQPEGGPDQPAQVGQKVGKLPVKRFTRLSLVLPDLGMGQSIVKFVSSSVIDADELTANLKWIRQQLGTNSMRFVPVVIYRAPRRFSVERPDGKSMTVIKHMLHVAYREMEQPTNLISANRGGEPDVESVLSVEALGHDEIYDGSPYSLELAEEQEEPGDETRQGMLARLADMFNADSISRLPELEFKQAVIERLNTTQTNLAAWAAYLGYTKIPKDASRRFRLYVKLLEVLLDDYMNRPGFEYDQYGDINPTLPILEEWVDETF